MFMHCSSRAEFPTKTQLNPIIYQFFQCFYYCFIVTKYDIMCEPYIKGVDDISMAKRNLGYIYFMSKFWDLIDTVSIETLLKLIDMCM